MINTRIKLKSDSQENWESANPVLLDGEMVVVKTSEGYRRYKIGDGISHYSELKFMDEEIWETMKVYVYYAPTNEIEN